MVPKPLGLKGAAFAAFGESPVGLIADPLTASDVKLELSKVGVKLGESILNFFLTLRVSITKVSKAVLKGLSHVIAPFCRRCMDLDWIMAESATLVVLSVEILYPDHGTYLCLHTGNDRISSRFCTMFLSHSL